MAPSHRHLASWPLLIIVAALGCGDAGGGTELGAATDGEAVVGGHVVSTVNGHPITLEQVAALSEAGKLDPREALQRLQSEKVLMAEAERRGFAAHPEVAHVGRRALVQSLLEDVAQDVEVTDAQLRERYEAVRQRYVSAEKRASVHVLCEARKSQSTPEQLETSRACVQELLPKLAEGEQPKEITRALKGERARIEAKYGLKLIVEQLPAVDTKAAFAESYLAALFGADGVGVYPEPVLTTFGWHGIRVTKIVPARDVPFEQAHEELLEEELVDRRAGAVRALIARLRASRGVELQQGAREALASWSQ